MPILLLPYKQVSLHLQGLLGLRAQLPHSSAFALGLRIGVLYVRVDGCGHKAEAGAVAPLLVAAAVG